jgi:hypothetical protein
MATDTKFVKGAEKLSRRIATIRAALALPVLVNETGELLLRRHLKRFDEQVDPSGRPWKPLAASTLARRGRANKSQSSRILYQTGQLRAAIRIIRGDVTGSIFSNTGAGVRIGVSDPDQVGKARVHNYGYGYTSQRRFLGVGPLDIRAVDALMRRRAATLENL